MGRMNESKEHLNEHVNEQRDKTHHSTITVENRHLLNDPLYWALNNKNSLFGTSTV